MASSNTFSDSLNALFKEKYADKIAQLIPDGVKLLNKIEFMGKDKQPGNLYHQPVILGLEHGVTFASSDDDAFNLNAPIAGATKDAQVRGNPVVLRSVLGYVSASRAMQGGDKTFMDATKFLVANMIRSIAKKLEIEMLHGQMGYASVASIAGNVLTITTAEWAPGIWAGAEGMPIEIRDVTGVTSRGEAVVSSVDLDARTVTLGSAPAGVVATDVVWHKGAFGNEFAGLHKIITNTGTLFNINAGSYALWKGNTYSAASGVLSFTKIEKGIAQAINKGLDGDVLCLVNPRGWVDLLAEQAAARHMDQSYKPQVAEAGHKSLKFYGQNGTIEIEPSIYVKEGYAYILAMDELMRVGSADVTFKRPGKDGEFFRELENSAGYELRCYSDQALFCSAPGKLVLINNVVNSA